MRKSSLYTHSSIKSRLTIQRQLILNILKKDFSHPNAEEIYKKVKKKLPKISIATVYRNLHFLNKMNLVREITMPDGPNRFDGHLKDHDHFICHVCKNIYNIPKYPLKTEYLPNKNYQIGSFKLDLFGVCAACKDKEPCQSAFLEKKC
jgi:Fe2+ or Zn2+ uptake regulation protein